MNSIVALNRAIVIWTVLGIPLWFTQSFTANAQSLPGRPQYIFVNRSPTSGDWSQNDPSSITDKLFDDPSSVVGATESKDRKLGVSFTISYFDGPPPVIEESLNRLLNLALKRNVPILIALDGENWWSYRPDLWNWWDPAKPGFNLNNRSNVEWYGWSESDAIKVGWRDWGRQIRVLPEPNLASPAFRRASDEELSRLVRIIARWRSALPADRRYLFPGIKVGWEASVGVNAYYYPNGNSYFDQNPMNPKSDPTSGLDMTKDFAGGVAPIGYAAMTSKGWVHPGSITVKDLGRVTGDYLAFLAACARRSGLSRNEIWTHAGGQFQPWFATGYSHSVAMNRDSLPGYSFYGEVDPRHAGDLGTCLDTRHIPSWCAAEWLPDANTSAEWRSAFDSSLTYENCGFVDVYNWEVIRNNNAAIAGLRSCLEERQ